MDLRRTMFTSNLEIVNNMQFAFDNGQSSYDLRVNCFADLSFEEFGAGWTGQGQLAGDSADIDPSIVPVTQRIVRTGRRNYNNFPTQLDWSQRGKLTPVLNQGGCNSCAAHASASSIESCLAIASSNEASSRHELSLTIILDSYPEPLSQQELIDCTVDFGTGENTELARSNNGCNSGYADVHLKWLQEEKQEPLKSAQEYPLTLDPLEDPVAGECRNDIARNGYSAGYFNYIVKRQVSFSYV